RIVFQRTREQPGDLMTRQSIVLAVAALAATFPACQATYLESPLPADHPANSAAAESLLPKPSQTLDLASAEPIAPAPPTPGMGHAGHDMSAAAPSHDGGHEHDVSPGTGAPAAGAFACPMHPEVTSDKPDQRCPRCGMKLKK